MKEAQRHRLVWKILQPVFETYLRLRYGYTHDQASREEPCLIIANHVTNWDPFFVAVSFRKQQISYVASEHLFRMGWLSKLIQWLVAVIPRRKGTTGMDTAMSCLRQLRAGQSVCIFGEGETTWDGITKSVFPATAMLAQVSGATLITYRIEGGYLTSPRWGKGVRRGRLHGGVVRAYSPQELKAMKKEEILEAINRDIYEDTWKNQKENPVAYKGKNAARYMESALFLCPACKQLGTLKGEGDHVRCRCGLDLRYTEYGLFEPAEPFENIAQWEAWQLEAYRNEDYCQPEGGITEDGVILKLVGDDHAFTVLGEGVLTMADGELALGEHRFALDVISNMAIVKTNRLIYSFNGQYYELLGPKHSCMRKFLLAWQNVRQANEGKSH